MCKNLKSDLSRYITDPKDIRNIFLLFEQGIWAVALYRLNHVLIQIRIPLIGFLCRAVAFFIFKFTEILTGISLPPATKIGRGLYIGHFGYCIVHQDAVLGENCSLGPGNVIGTRGVGKEGVPRLGDNVYLGTGAKILGNVTIGNNVRVGANAVVLDDVPNNCTVVGIPGKIVGKS
jgi:serine O-acetyltransferase